MINEVGLLQTISGSVIFVLVSRAELELHNIKVQNIKIERDSSLHHYKHKNWITP